MQYNNFRQRAINITEVNRLLEKLKKFNRQILFGTTNDSIKAIKMSVKDFNYTKYDIIKEDDSKLIIETLMWEPKFKATRYICNLNGEEQPEVKGLRAFNKLQQYCYKAPHVKTYNHKRINDLLDPDTGRYTFSAGPIVDYNPKYENIELYNIYEYDLNSAYASVMLDKIPDLHNPQFNTKLKRGQVGFLLDNKCSMIEMPGTFCEVVFDLIELTEQQKKYIYNLYYKIHHETDKTKRAEYKIVMNAAIGYYQRFNPFMRSYIVNRCNDRIKSLLDENSVLWNTDAIFSLKRRPELEIGDDIGQFKEIQISRFAYHGNNYQINYDLPKYRGIPKAWFKESWDILKDPVPKRCNKYIFDNMKIIENEEYYEKTNKSTKEKE